jgi:hypothetical protein
MHPEKGFWMWRKLEWTTRQCFGVQKSQFGGSKKYSAEQKIQGALKHVRLCSNFAIVLSLYCWKTLQNMTSQLNFNLEKWKCKVAVYHVEAVRILGPNFSKHLRLLFSWTMQSWEKSARDNFVDLILGFQNHIWFMGIGVEVEVQSWSWSWSCRAGPGAGPDNLKFKFELELQLQSPTWYDMTL